MRKKLFVYHNYTQIHSDIVTVAAHGGAACQVSYNKRIVPQFNLF